MLLKLKFTRCFLHICCNKFQFIFILIVIFVIFCASHVGEVMNNFFKTDLLEKNSKYCGEPIDIVYTWVNGSDSIFRETLKQYLANNKHQYPDYSDERFDDKYELKFSLRSLEKYAPWFNHVYIVTNGQIPYWLNLDYEKVSIISHNEIFENPDNLPTFSSPAIEKNIHKIPGLSEKFIYFNDDIFLGAPVYPDDFVSFSRGYLIYLAWPLPSCMPNCPWIYVGDGQCDGSCFYEECQFDGGDCTEPHKKKHHHHEDPNEGEDVKSPIDYEYFEEDKRDLEIIKNQTLDKKGTLLGSITIPESQPKIKNNKTTNELLRELLKKQRDTKHFKTYFKNNNTVQNMSKLVNEHNSKIILDDKFDRKKKLYKTIHNRRKFYNKLFTNSSSGGNKTRNKLSLDTFALSLQHTHKLFNMAYEFKARKVPAHSPILIEKQIMVSLQRKFAKHFETTEQNKLRSANDMQYAFSYYYFLMNEKTQNNISNIFDYFDTDNSGTWSDREIRTILTRINDLPLNFAMVERFDQAILNCSKHVKPATDVNVPNFERYLDSKLPLVTKKLILNCPQIINTLNAQFGVFQKHKYEIIKNAQSNYVLFKMLSSNVSDVVGHLDEIRKDPRKFVCLNDNMSANRKEDNELVKAILFDFYQSLFPKPSKFELPREFRNRFNYLEDLQKWKMYHVKLKLIVISLIVVLSLLILCHNCKRRLLRRIKRVIY